MADSQLSIQVARVRGSVFVFPWMLLYDIPLESNRDKYKVCKILDHWEEGLFLSSEPLSKCPYASEHAEENFICPFGFWGFRHNIEQPPATQNNNLPILIQAGDPLQIVVCRSIDLDKKLSTDHLKGIEKALPGFTVLEARSRDSVRASLTNPAIEIVYFYCHGRREKGPSGKTTKAYLEVGKGEQINPEDITTWHLAWSKDPGHWKTTPLVFVNGCHTMELTPESLVNFADAFSSANAGGVIGTEITIDQRVANEAAEQFLLHFGSKKPVGEALHRMRLHFLEKGNLLGLAYTAYCSADLKLVH
jgi:hypothetical protein